MATDISRSNELPASLNIGAIPMAILKTLASLKLTVVLFALGIFIIFYGTLAQVEKDMWDVIELYFRSWIAMIDLQLLFPRTWFPGLAGKIPGRFPMPGGALIGAFMAINLIAAHLVRFKIQAKGPELLLGLAIIAVGSVVTYWVIASGHNKSGLQGEPPFSWEMFWNVIRASLFLITMASGVALAISNGASKAARMSWLAAAVICGGLGVWSVSMMPSPSALRILWQLVQGGLAGVVLLIGCMFVFKKRAGIVVLHAGIALIMFSEFYVSQYAVEGRMSIREGETMNYVKDIRTTELAIVNSSSTQEDDVTVIPGSRLVPPRTFFGLGAPSEKDIVIADKQLPFDIHVEKYIKNADLGSLDLAGVAAELDMLTSTQSRQARQFERMGSASMEELLVDRGFLDAKQIAECKTVLDERIANNYATAGAGKDFVAEEVRAASGTDGGEVDLAAAYVDIRKKDTDESLGKYLLSQILTVNDEQEKIEIDGKTYNVSLRFKRTYKDYSLSLKDVRKDDYLGTNTPMNYSSDVVVMDRKENAKVGDFKIWMNNPLRYSGETFYQSGYVSKARGGGTEATDLQVVTNTGWMMPYVGCMLVWLGMMVHFSSVLWRFLTRVSKEQVAQETPSSRWGLIVPAVFVLLFVGYAGSKLRPPNDTKANMNLSEFGKLPVVYQGRVKPLDTLARNTLRIISDKEQFEDHLNFNPDVDRKPKKRPAIQWMMDVMAGSPEAGQHRVYRIDNPDVQTLLDLDPKRKRFRYGLDEFRDKIGDLEAQLRQMPEEDEERSLFQQKLVQLERRLRAQRLVEVAFGRVIPPMPTQQQLAADPEKAKETAKQIQRMLMNLPQLENALSNFQPPLSIPLPEGDAMEGREWVAFATAWNEKYGKELFEQLGLDTSQAPNFPKFKSNKAAELWDTMLYSYADGKTKPFNDALAEYQQLLEDQQPAKLDSGKVRFEHYFNHFQPFTVCAAFYLVAFVLVLAGWLLSSFGALRVLNRSAFWLICATFVLHTLALAGRVYISGRPPITNLYSSAVFIGWGAVGFGLLLELFYGRSKSYVAGIGNILASHVGFLTLLIAYGLAADGDTFTVLQAVLDTQFWLATHVVCISLGYTTTFVAGALGVLYIVTLAWRNPEFGKSLASMTYGTLCFAIFFSFVGTVLGGLWADDSWGRFWGWDPKENGALIIVLWNALILHARWGGIVRQKGMAILAVLGNITTAWSWFGVSELGVGLHSYGFTEGRLPKLALFVASQMLVVLIGCWLMSSNAFLDSILGTKNKALQK